MEREITAAWSIVQRTGLAGAVRSGLATLPTTNPHNRQPPRTNTHSNWTDYRVPVSSGLMGRQPRYLHGVSRCLVTLGLAADVIGVLIVFFTTRTKFGLAEVLVKAEINSDQDLEKAVAVSAWIRMFGVLLIVSGFVMQGIAVWL